MPRIERLSKKPAKKPAMPEAAESAIHEKVTPKKTISGHSRPTMPPAETTPTISRTP